jgi:hypothetical protein
LQAPSEAAQYQRDQVITIAEKDVNFLGGICVPEIFKYFLPSIFLAIWALLVNSVKQEKGILRLAIGIPRGFAKTAFLKIYCVYIILFCRNRNFILIVCNTEALAANFISDVFDILSSTNIKSLFGDWRMGLGDTGRDTQTLKKFGFRGRDIIIAGVGTGTSLRGITLKFRRPDVIIMDDMQSREEAENKKTANDQLTWLLGTLMKARNYERCLFIFVGNMYPFEGSILRKLKHNPQWISFICGAILADGQSLWPQFRPIEDLLAELEHDLSLGKPEIFYSEVLNDEEAGTVSGIDLSKIPTYPEHLDEIEPQGGCIIIDPASGKKEGNDVAIGLFLIYDGTPVFRKVENDKFSPLGTIHAALKMAIERRIGLIAVESNAYQYTLLFWFDFVCRQLGITGIELVPLEAQGYSKNSKIKSLLNSLCTGRPLLHPDVRSKVIYQASQFNPLKQKNEDDLLDIAAWVDKVILLHNDRLEIKGYDYMKLLDGMSDISAATTLEEMPGVTF